MRHFGGGSGCEPIKQLERRHETGARARGRLRDRERLSGDRHRPGPRRSAITATHETVPVPTPDAPAVTVMNASLLVADHEHALVVVTVIAPVAELLTDAPAGDSANDTECRC